jgi:hypothetical protein
MQKLHDRIAFAHHAISVAGAISTAVQWLIGWFG